MIALPKVDGFWELGLLTIRDPDFGGDIEFREEDVSLIAACWLTVSDGRTSIVLPLDADNINRIQQWTTKARQNLTERNRRAKR